MSLSGTFNPTGSNPLSTEVPVKQRAKRPAPFSLRLSETERACLIEGRAAWRLHQGEGAGLRASRSCTPKRPCRPGSVKRWRKFSLLGRSCLSSNLNQLAHAANIGALLVTPETEAELNAALAEMRELRRLLMVALGLKLEARPPSYAKATEGA